MKIALSEVAKNLGTLIQKDELKPTIRLICSSIKFTSKFALDIVELVVDALVSVASLIRSSSDIYEVMTTLYLGGNNQPHVV